jgi:flavin reductase (DIM6/NTAB) family NADH-FMN oxidoreductase RutF
MTASGALLLGGAAAWLECAVRTSVPAGDHGLVPLDIHELAAESGTAPLVYWHSGFVGLRD